MFGAAGWTKSLLSLRGLMSGCHGSEIKELTTFGDCPSFPLRNKQRLAGLDVHDRKH